MKIKKIIILFFVMSAFTQVFAIDGILVKTIDYSFKEKWNNNLSMPVLSTCDTIFVGQNVFISAIAGDYKLNSENTVIVEYSIKIIKPDKSIYFSQEGLPIINSVLQNSENLYMSEAILKMSFEQKDLLGEYKIEIVITDKVANKSKILKSSLFLTDIMTYEMDIVENIDDFSSWFSNYYKNPKPETALPNYLYYSKSELSEDDSKFYTMFSVFVEIFKNNKFLLPQVLNSFAKQDAKTKVFLIYLLHFSDIGAEEFLEKLEGDEKKYYTEVKTATLPNLYGDILYPTQLDMLWATFLAGGSYKPIEKLFQTLDYVKYKGEIEKYEKSKDKTEQERQRAINNSIYSSLVWSIKSNCKQHSLVKGYAEWTLRYGSLNIIQKNELKNIIEDL